MASSKIDSIFNSTDKVRIQQIASPDGGGTTIYRAGNAGEGLWSPSGALFIGYRCLYVASMAITGSNNGFDELYRIYDANSSNPPIALDANGRILVADNRHFIAILPERIKLVEVSS